MSLAPPITFKSLPVETDYSISTRNRMDGIYVSLSQTLIHGLVGLFQGKNVLECYAGRGHMSALLNEQGVSIQSTSLRMGHDQSGILGHVYPVEDISVEDAVAKYADWMDYLLVCWPTTDSGLEKALEHLPTDVPIVFIGEVTDYTISPPFYGGCATDRFFEMVEPIPELEGKVSYYSFSQDKIMFYRKK